MRGLAPEHCEAHGAPQACWARGGTLWFWKPCCTATELKSTTLPAFFLSAGSRHFTLSAAPTWESRSEERSFKMTRNLLKKDAPENP